VQGSEVSLSTFALAVSERWYAWRASRVMLKRYQRARGRNARLSGRPLYEEILARHCGYTERGAAAVLDGAEGSYCAWPVKRELRFRDVVSYLLTQEYLHRHDFLRGTQTDMRRVVARVIPAEF
jgi:hypothetical protein